ncbi:MAG: diphosphate--fructose-6-phosphate 1-phosphotransferase [Parachlamydiaceae bacterium]
MFSLLQQARLQFKPQIPTVLQAVDETVLVPQPIHHHSSDQITERFPKTSGQQLLEIHLGSKSVSNALRVGVLLSGGQAPGGHNVISGLFDALKAFHPDSVLIGFYDGPSGVLTNKRVEITDKLLESYRNQGGFDIIGSSRTKIETEEQFLIAEKTVKENKLDGLVIVGGDDSNTNAAFLAEFFLSRGCPTRVIGVPKTIDGDLQSDLIEISFGFDTACKVYSETIGNLMRDCLSAKKYYYFIKLMGRSASHITLECALQTHPNLALISEEIAKEGKTLEGVVDSICDMVCTRSAKGKNYGVILVPEGVIEFIPEVRVLIEELNNIMSLKSSHHDAIDKEENKDTKIVMAAKLLSTAAQPCFLSLPKDIQAQLLIGRDPHGNVQVSKIETERMLMSMVKSKLKKRDERIKFDPISHFCGYEGRSALPSNFDSQYCYALGRVAAILIKGGATGYICYVNNLTKRVEKWEAGGVPLTQLMVLEKRHGETKPVVKKTLVDLEGNAFSQFHTQRAQWAVEDDYIAPGPIQFYGPPELTDGVPNLIQV